MRKRGQVSRLEASFDHRAKRRKRKTRSTQRLLGSYNSELNITDRTGAARTQNRGHSTKRRRPESSPFNTISSGCTRFKVIAITEQHDAAGPTQETILQWRRQGLTEAEGIGRFSTDNARSGIRTRHIYEFKAEYTNPGGGQQQAAASKRKRVERAKRKVAKEALTKHTRKRQPKGSAGHAKTRDRRMTEFFMRHEEDATHNTTSRSNVEVTEELSTRNDVGTPGRTVAKAVD